MAASVRISESELLDALASAVKGTGPDEALTVPEMAARQGLSEERVRKALKFFQAEGRLNVHRVIRQALDGRMAQVAAYTITPKRGKK